MDTSKGACYGSQMYEGQKNPIKIKGKGKHY
jgi:hypothetical protein